MFKQYNNPLAPTQPEGGEFKPCIFGITITRLANGYVFHNMYTNKIPNIGKFLPDMEALIREFALVVGGEDAVPVNMLSAEEAGLLNEPDLFISGVTATASSTISHSGSISITRQQAHVAEGENNNG